MENMEIKSPIGIVAVTIGSIIWSSEFNLAIGFVLNTNKGQIKNSLINRYDACASQFWMLFSIQLVGVRLKEDKICNLWNVFAISKLMYLPCLNWYLDLNWRLLSRRKIKMGKLGLWPMWSASPGWQPSHKSCMQHRHHHRHPHHHHQPLHFEIYITQKMKIWLPILATDKESN